MAAMARSAATLARGQRSDSINKERLMNPMNKALSLVLSTLITGCVAGPSESTDVEEENIAEGASAANSIPAPP